MAIELLTSGPHYGTITGYKGIGGATNRYISFWRLGPITANASVTGNLVYYGTELAGQRFELSEVKGGGDPNRIVIGVHSGNRYWRGGNSFDGSWHHHAFILNGTSTLHLEYYRDNVLIAPLTTAAKILNTGNTIDVQLFKGRSPTFPGQAKIFDFRMYSDAKGSADRTAIFNGEGCDDVIANLETRHVFWPETGVAVTELDVSGNGRHMALSNGPNYVADIFAPCFVGGFPLLDGALKSPLVEGGMI